MSYVIHNFTESEVFIILLPLSLNFSVHCLLENFIYTMILSIIQCTTMLSVSASDLIILYLEFYMLLLTSPYSATSLPTFGSHFFLFFISMSLPLLFFYISLIKSCQSLCKTSLSATDMSIFIRTRGVIWSKW